MTGTYEEDSLFCSECTEDYGLRSKIRMIGTHGVCSVCEEEAEFSVRFDEIASWLELIWKEWFHIGAERPVMSAHSDRVEYQQLGDDPELLIGELVQCPTDEEGVIRSLIGLMSSGDHAALMDGGDPLIEDCQNYQKRDLEMEEVKNRWNHFVLDLKHHTRYFNEKAIEFFEKLFADLTDVHVQTTGDTSFLQSQDASREANSVVRQYDPGSITIFRARKANTPAVQDRIIDFPEAELSNPPDDKASEGRMNPKGISYFYGAEDRETCVAELRPSISENVISAEFELIESVRLLDFTLLSRSHHQSSESMFDDDYLEVRVHRELLRQLHQLIAQPVLDGDEFEYLPTQAMSEYLARCSNPRIDGLIFESVQQEGGRNIVLFPHVLRSENFSANDFMPRDSAISIKADSLILHEVKKIERRLIDQRIIDGRPEMLLEDYDGYYF